MKRAICAATLALLFGAQGAWGQCVSKRVQFQRGRTTASLHGRVSAARAVCYELRTRAGQRMTIRLTSLRKVVRLGVMPPGFDREPLVEGVTQWDGVLEEGGDYAISLSLPKGSDTYTFEITIQ